MKLRSAQEIVISSRLLLDLIYEKGGVRVVFNAGTHFIPDDNYIYFLKKGDVSIFCAKKTTRIGTVTENMPIGLVEMIVPSFKAQYLCVSEVTLVKISWLNFLNTFRLDKNESAALLAVLVNFSASLINEKTSEKSRTAYDSVVCMLRQYLKAKENDPTLTEGIASYVIKRTGLSKSYVFEILSELKCGGYISTSKGKLVAIHKKLPLAY